jgi:fructokinase
MKITPNLLENYEMADIVRGSDEDFRIMYRKDDCDSIYRSEISFYTKKFIYTRGAKPVEVRADGGFVKQYAVPPTTTVSTIGAGDNFNAGFVYGLIRYGITREHIKQGLSEQQWDQLMACAQAFSANCCQSLSNCIDTDFANKMHF